MGSVNGSIVKDSLYGILKDCFSGIAKIDIDEQNIIAMSLKSKYVKKRPQKILSQEFDSLIDDVFEHYQERLYSDNMSNHYPHLGLNNSSSKTLDHQVDRSYNHQDPNSKIIIFDTKKDALIHDHRYIIVKTLLGKNIALPDITINTREYIKNPDGYISFSKNPRLNNAQIQKYLAFVIGAVNIFGGYESTNASKLNVISADPTEYNINNLKAASQKFI
ncbi:MAG TPA: hypothetical protein VEC16_00965 [Alphaproteobacteria bacterium]|nr:hypothetical protein [Alphaproteobacteria bacterium]